MEIIVRKNDLVKELHARAGDRRAQELDPDPVERPGGGAGRRGADLRHRPRCLPPLRMRGAGGEGGAITLGAKKLYEIARSLPESDMQIKVLPDPGPRSTASACTSRWRACRARTSRPCRRRKAGEGSRSRRTCCAQLISRTAFAITAEDARYYLAGALLVLDKERRPWSRPTATGWPTPQRKAAAQGERAAARARAAQGDQRDRAAAREAEESRVLPAGGEPPRLLGRGADARLQVGRRAVPGLREGDRASRATRAVSLPARRSPVPSGASACSPPSASAGGRAGAGRGPAGAGRVLARPRRGQGGAATRLQGRGVEIGFNAQYLLDFLGVAGSDDVSLELKDARARGSSGRRATDRPTTATSSCRCGSERQGVGLGRAAARSRDLRNIREAALELARG